MFSVILVLIAAALVFLMLVLGGRLRPGAQRAASRRLKNNPITSSVTPVSETSGRSLTGWVSRLQHPHLPIAPIALAFLQPVTDSESALDSPPIPITSDEISIGSNPDKATLVLEDPSIEGLHARLVHAPGGAFRLIDQGSIAGTWINFGPVPANGATLQHGDIVHFGRIGFRFTVHASGPVLKPNIIEDGELHSEEEPGRDPGNPLETGLESSQDSTSESEQEAEESTP